MVTCRRLDVGCTLWSVRIQSSSFSVGRRLATLLMTFGSSSRAVGIGRNFVPTAGTIAEWLPIRVFLLEWQVSPRTVCFVPASVCGKTHRPVLPKHKVASELLSRATNASWRALALGSFPVFMLRANYVRFWSELCYLFVSLRMVESMMRSGSDAHDEAQLSSLACLSLQPNHDLLPPKTGAVVDGRFHSFHPTVTLKCRGAGQPPEVSRIGQR